METRETYPYPPLNLAQQRSMRRQVPRKFRVWNFRRFAYVSPEKCPEKCLGSGRPTSLEHGGFAEADSDKGVVALASSNNVAGFVDKLGEGEGVAHHLLGWRRRRRSEGVSLQSAQPANPEPHWPRVLSAGSAASPIRLG